MARQGLTRAQVIEAARQLVNREGLDALTMRKLSKDLHVEAPSLYSHVKNKSDILDGLAELVFGEVKVAPSDDPWQQRIGQYSRALRQALLANPNVVPVISVRPVISVSTLQLIEEALGELTVMGLSHRQAIFTLDTLVSFVMGHVLTELSANPIVSGHDPEAVAAARAALPAEIFPNVAKTLAEGIVDRNAEFEHGVAMLVAGIENLLAA